ncbi:flavodoxin [Streptococcus pneumoniae]|nr:flavodoxin [Streptococcus pneumoniae]
MALAKIVFASMTGNTEEIADIVADKLRDLGLDVDVDDVQLLTLQTSWKQTSLSLRPILMVMVNCQMR